MGIEERRGGGGEATRDAALGAGQIYTYIDIDIDINIYTKYINR